MNEIHEVAIPLSSSHCSDERFWALTKNGLYYVKTAYMLGKGCKLDLVPQAWVAIWGMDTSPKARHFLCVAALYEHPPFEGPASPPPLVERWPMSVGLWCLGDSSSCGFRVSQHQGSLG